MAYVYSNKFPKLYDSTMSLFEFKARVRRIYPKLGITNIMQMAGVMGYTPHTAMKSFRYTGVSPQAQIILRLFEAIPSDILKELINEEENK